MPLRLVIEVKPETLEATVVAVEEVVLPAEAEAEEAPPTKETPAEEVAPGKVETPPSTEEKPSSDDPTFGGC